MRHADGIDESPATTDHRRRWLVGSVALLVAVAALRAFVLSQDDDPEPVFCPADGMIGRNGEIFGRTGPDCRFVDENGKTLTTLSSGEPLCYDDLELMSVAPCDQHGVTPAEDL